MKHLRDFDLYMSNINEGINYNGASDADLVDVGAYLHDNPENATDEELAKAATEAMKKASPVPLTGEMKKDLPALLKYLKDTYKKCGIDLDTDNTEIDSSNFANELMIPVADTEYYLNTYLDYVEMASNGSEFVIGGWFASDDEGSLEYGAPDLGDQGEIMKACQGFKQYLENNKK